MPDLVKQIQIVPDAPARPDGGMVAYVVDAIRTRILEGQYGPGQRLVEAELTSSLGVSRGPLREAMHRLAAEGLVQIQANRGACVTRASRREVHDMFVIRELLEGQAARQVAEQAHEPETKKALKALRDREEVVDQAMDAVSFMRANQRLHDTLIALSGSEMIGRILSQLQMPQFRAAFFRSFSTRIYEQSRRDHLAIIDALMQPDAEKAEALMRSHVRATATLVASMPDEFFAD